MKNGSYHHYLRTLRIRTGDNVIRYKRAGLAIFAFAAIPIVFSDCAKSEAPVSNTRPYQYIVPEKTNDGWETASLSSENLDANLIKDLFERINDNTYKNIYSVVIIKNGKLVVEEYFPRQDILGDQRGRQSSGFRPSSYTPRRKA